MSVNSLLVRLNQVAELNPRASAALNNDVVVSFLSMSAVAVEGTTSEGDERRYAEVSRGYTVFENGDILIAKITPCFENGKIAQATLNNKYGVGSTEFHVVRPNLERLDGRYLLHFLRQTHVRLDGTRRMTGSAGHRRVPVNFFSDLEVFLPSLSEQKRIGTILDMAESIRVKRRAAIKKVDELVQAVFIEMFGDPLKNPHQLPVVPLVNLVSPHRPISYGILMPGPDQDEGVSYVRVVDMKDGGIDVGSVRKTTVEISTAFKRSLLKEGDILMSIRGHVGRLASVPPELEGANITQDTARLAVDELKVLPVFARECLRTEGVQRWMAKHIKGVAVRGINLADVKKIPVILPSIEMQKEFVLKVSSIESLVSSYRIQLNQLETLFSSLQHLAFRGEL